MNTSNEITDLDTLVSLDELYEQNKSTFRNVKEMKQFDKSRRDAHTAALCMRCRHLRFDNKVIVER